METYITKNEVKQEAALNIENENASSNSQYNISLIPDISHNTLNFKPISEPHKEDHTSQMVEAAKNFKCPFCEYSTSSKKDMKMHLKLHDEPSDDETEQHPTMLETADNSKLDTPDYIHGKDLLCKNLECEQKIEIKQEVISEDDSDNYDTQYVQEENSFEYIIPEYNTGLKQEPNPIKDLEDEGDQLCIEDHKMKLDFEIKVPKNEAQNSVEYENKLHTSIDIKEDKFNPNKSQETQNISYIQFVAIADDKTKQFSCEYCSFKTGSKPYLTAHLKTEHAEYSEYILCIICPYKAVTRTELNRHFKLKHDEHTEVYKCSFCPFKTKYKPELNRHYKLKHDETSTSFACVYCKYVTKRKPSLTRHIRIRHNEQTEKLVCPHCVYSTKWKQSLNSHVKRIHHKAVFQCNQCDYKTIYEQNLVLHGKSSHPIC